MSLPPPPLALAGYAPTQAAHRELDAIVAKYGQQCWQAALEEAAEACDTLAKDWGDVAEESGMNRCAKEIRSMK